jgi:hypothetical protein
LALWPLLTEAVTRDNFLSNSRGIGFDNFS